jgi:hypothetical protein
VVLYGMSLLLILPGLSVALNTSQRPLLDSGDLLAVQLSAVPRLSITEQSRTANRFIARPDVMEANLNAIDYLSEGDCAAVGLVNGGDDWEYPLLYLVHERKPSVKFQHMASLQSLSTRYVSFEPCAVVYLSETMNPGPLVAFAGYDGLFGLVNNWQSIKVYERQGLFPTYAYHNSDHSVNIFPQDDRTLHVYADCVGEACQLVSVIDVDALAKTGGTTLQEASTGWHTEVTYIGPDLEWQARGYAVDVYRVQVYNAEHQLVDGALELLVTPELVVWLVP